MFGGTPKKVNDLLRQHVEVIANKMLSKMLADPDALAAECRVTTNAQGKAQRLAGPRPEPWSLPDAGAFMGSAVR